MVLDLRIDSIDILNQQTRLISGPRSLTTRGIAPPIIPHLLVVLYAGSVAAFMPGGDPKAGLAAGRCSRANRSPMTLTDKFIAVSPPPRNL